MKINQFKKFISQYDNKISLTENNFIPVKSDASKRIYYRIISKDKNLIFMDSSKEKKSLNKFILISDWLIDNNLSAPKIIFKDMQKGFCLIEDLGQNKFSNYFLNQPNQKYSLYKSTIDLLVHFSNISVPHFLTSYSKKEFKRELNIFIKWYIYRKNRNNIKQITIWNNVWNELFSNLEKKNNHAVILRDFHIDNLFFLNDRKEFKKIGLIDFQDAVYGHKSYDLVSLLQDVRVFIPYYKERELLDYYLDLSKDSRGDFKEAYYIFGTQRLFKIIGIFQKLYYVDKKKEYLHYLPRTWQILNRNLKQPLLKKLKFWVERNV